MTKNAMTNTMPHRMAVTTERSRGVIGSSVTPHHAGVELASLRTSEHNATNLEQASGTTHHPGESGRNRRISRND
jgi:hypothetical protein